jgi:hypothetical protein
MSHFYERYQQGFYQEVYDDLLAMQEQVFEETTYQDAVLVARAIMQRVRSNIEVLIPRVKSLNYTFVDGYLDEEYLHRYAPEEQAKINQMYRVFQPPSPEAPQQLNALEQRVGTFPMSLRCWYEEVGSVNLVGTFPVTKMSRERAVVLDPLFIEALASFLEWSPEEEDGLVELDLAPDDGFKYGYSSGGPYVIKIPNRAFDAPFELDHQAPMFIEYLRTCFQWGGFFGLSEARNQPLTSEELAFLTRDLLPF